ncbi:MAG: HAMP domain-containing sensor histidine kinase [Tissierellia bacterium]|nr:HAMP domain-containing sensor histidine kinase [Tissierellia bacterium]
MGHKILKKTIRFMLSFMGISFLFLLLMGISLIFLPTGTSLIQYLPWSNNLDPDTLNWEEIVKIGGYGLELDRDGNVIKSYGKKKSNKRYTTGEVLDLFDLRESGDHAFSYQTSSGNKLLIFYPENVFSKTPTMNISEMTSKNRWFQLGKILGVFALYLYFVYRIIGKLIKSIRVEIQEMQKEEDKRVNLFFRGLAHDVKTPLSAIIAYAKALDDDLVKPRDQKKYYGTIYRNGLLLKERVEDMLSLTALGEEGIYQPERRDLLKDTRNYIKEHYDWYENRGGRIHLDFPQKEYITSFDPKLWERVLANLLQNSVDHNDQPVEITVRWKNQQIIIKDDGKGISEEILPYLFEPMFTGDESRTGSKLRGMGLANVKRILDLHQWTIEYDDGFCITVH